MECWTPTVSFDIFMSNSFTFSRLLTYIRINNIRVTGVLNKNRLHKYTITEDQQLQRKKKCGLFELRFSNIKAV